MQLTQKFVENYKANNPNATVEDLLKDFKLAIEKAKQDEIDSNAKRRQFYKNLVGHCYRIELAPLVFLYVNIDKELEIRGSFISNISGISVNNSGELIAIETNRKINPDWFNNPYNNVRSVAINCEEITKVEYDKVVKLFNDMKIMIKNTL